jgi:hypothetical protein
MMLVPARDAKDTINARCSSALRGRKGSMLADVAMSAVMLMIAMTLTVKVLGWMGIEHRAWDRRQWAAQEASNLMEQATARPFDGVSTATLKELSLSPQALRLLPGAELSVNVVENDQAGGPNSKRVGVRLRWKDRSGGWDSPVQLTTWIYRGRPGS